MWITGPDRANFITRARRVGTWFLEADECNDMTMNNIEELQEKQHYACILLSSRTIRGMDFRALNEGLNLFIYSQFET